MITAIFLLIFNIDKGSTDLSFLNTIRKIIGKEVKDKSLKGIFKTVIYLGSKVKISCHGKKFPIQVYREFSWYHAGKRISNTKHYTVDKYGVLTIHEVLAEDSGTFVCSAKSKNGKLKFRHEVTVLQLPSKSLHIHFVYAVRLCTEASVEFARRFIESKVKEKVCSRNECHLSYIHGKCQFQEFANPNLKITVPVLLPGIPNGSCNAECTRKVLENTKKEVKGKVIYTVMKGRRLKIREEPREMSISYFETEEDNICKPGFEMKGTHSRSICIPCLPGHFLENGYCIPCHLNHYNGKYAATECHTCFGRRVTRSRGAISEEECFVSDPYVIWILLTIFIIAIPLILVCFCWSFVKLLGESLANCCNYLCSYATCFSGLFRSSNENTASKEKSHKGSKSSKAKQSFKHGEGKGSKAAETPIPIPSARHSTAKSFFYKTPENVVNKVPVPPALPKDSVIIQSPKNPTDESAGDAPLKGSDNKKGKIDAQRNNMQSIFQKTSIGDLPYYPERILKNPAMYNAIKKSFA